MFRGVKPKSFCKKTKIKAVTNENEKLELECE